MEIVSSRVALLLRSAEMKHIVRSLSISVYLRAAEECAKITCVNPRQVRHLHFTSLLLHTGVHIYGKQCVSSVHGNLFSVHGNKGFW
jgi:hypothetical protein